MFQVPLPVPILIYETVPDETGFTMPEKIALRNAWTLIGGNKEFYAHELFINFFSDHELLLNKFRNSNGEFRMNELHKHPYGVFYSIESMIFEGLEGPQHMHGIISPVVKHHLQKNVSCDDIEAMTGAFGTYLKGVFQRILSPTLELAIDKICRVITSTVKDEH